MYTFLHGGKKGLMVVLPWTNYFTRLLMQFQRNKLVAKSRHVKFEPLVQGPKYVTDKINKRISPCCYCYVCKV